MNCSLIFRPKCDIIITIKKIKKIDIEIIPEIVKLFSIENWKSSQINLKRKKIHANILIIKALLFFLINNIPDAKNRIDRIVLVTNSVNEKYEEIFSKVTFSFLAKSNQSFTE